MRRVILLFVKHPAPGKVKTRLAATVGADRAVEIYRQLVENVASGLPEGIAIRVMFDPPEEEQAVCAWLQPLLPVAEFLPQASGDLGQRLEQAFACAFDEGWEQVAVIGSDCVELTPAIFNETWGALSAGNVAIGPTEDGGYYLLGLCNHAPALFQEITWSSESVLRETLAQAAAQDLRGHLLPKLRDVDTEDDWQRAAARLQ
jgi:rSAM/selenodomain-associated transferase 1